ncbi:MAG: hypothetical protein IT171_02505, partial [Acidobacteria bacterium]|nr:hypothetical protein [Acidobacteriota bacterium]
TRIPIKKIGLNLRSFFFAANISSIFNILSQNPAVSFIGDLDDHRGIAAKRNIL